MRWERGNVSNVQITQFQAGVPIDYSGSIVQMGQIIGGTSDPTTIPGQLDAWKTRSIDIGGLVFSSFSFLNGQRLEGVSAHVLCWHALIIDRLDDLGNPAAGLPPFDQPTHPMVFAGASGLTGEMKWPTRVLWIEQRVIGIGQFDENTPNPQSYNAGSRSLRLRLRLTDEFGLFWVFAVRKPQNLTSFNFTISHVLAGSLYWRSRY